MISLTDAIDSLRDELTQATARAATEASAGVLLTVTDVEVELQVDVTKEIKGSTEVNVWMVKIGGEGAASRADTHTIRLKLTPRAPDGGPLPVGSRGRHLPEPPAPSESR